MLVGCTCGIGDIWRGGIFHGQRDSVSHIAVFLAEELSCTCGWLAIDNGRTYNFTTSMAPRWETRDWHAFMNANGKRAAKRIGCEKFLGLISRFGDRARYCLAGPDTMRRSQVWEVVVRAATDFSEIPWRWNQQATRKRKKRNPLDFPPSPFRSVELDRGPSGPLFSLSFSLSPSSVFPLFRASLADYHAILCSSVWLLLAIAALSLSLFYRPSLFFFSWDFFLSFFPRYSFAQHTLVITFSLSLSPLRETLISHAKADDREERRKWKPQFLVWHMHEAYNFSRT